MPCSPALRFAVVGSPAYFVDRNPPLVPGDLALQRCVRNRMPSGAVSRWEFEKHGEALDIEVDGPLTLDNPNLRVEAALSGVGLAWVNEWSAAPHIAAGRLARVLEDWTPIYPGLCLYYPTHRHISAGLRTFVALIREVNALSPSAG